MSRCWGHWVKLFLMATLGMRPESSWTTRMSICEQKETSRRTSRGHDWRSFFSEAGLTNRVPVRQTNHNRDAQNMKDTNTDLRNNVMSEYFLKRKQDLYFFVQIKLSSSVAADTDLHTFQWVNHWSTSEITKELTHQHSLNNTEASVLSKPSTYATGTQVLLLCCCNFAYGALLFIKLIIWVCVWG